MPLPLDDRPRAGIQTIHRRTEPATGPWLPRIDELVELVDHCGYDSLWVGDHGEPSAAARHGATPKQVTLYIDRQFGYCGFATDAHDSEVALCFNLIYPLQSQRC